MTILSEAAAWQVLRHPATAVLANSSFPTFPTHSIMKMPWNTEVFHAFLEVFLVTMVTS